MAGLDMVVAGHLCLDVIPAIPPAAGGLAALLAPGNLVHTGPAVVSTGGAVANTGLALHRLGAPVRLAALTGRDVFGGAVRDIVERFGSGLSRSLMVRDDVSTSYSVVVNVPGVDRIFLHCPGANDAFDADSLRPELFARAGWFHFGYPPLMRKLFADGGSELEKVFAKARAAGLPTSLDMARPDPASPAGKADWPAILRRALPRVDVFLPSFDEITYMLDGAVETVPTLERLRDISSRLLAMGTGAVLLKLGDQGAYLRTASGGPGPGAAGDAAAWQDRELYRPCFQVKAAGATGAGDCTIAGFLYGIRRELTPEQCLRAATAVGACNVEHPDATTGIVPWPEVESRLSAGWPSRPPADWALAAGWRETAEGAWQP